MLGIPKLPRLTDFKGTINSILGTAQSQLWGLISSSTWAIYKQGTTTEAVAVDSILELTLQSESNVPDYRLQTDSFASYNKVAFPYEIPLRLAKGGSVTEREALITWLQENVGKPTLFDIQTPEKVYGNVTLTRFSNVRRREGGEDLLTVDCSFKEIREVSPQYWKDGESTIKNAKDAEAVATTPLQKVTSTISNIRTGAQNVFKTINRVKNDPLGTLQGVVSGQYTQITTSVYDAAEVAKNTAKNLIKYTQGAIGNPGVGVSTTAKGTRVGVDISK